MESLYYDINYVDVEFKTIDIKKFIKFLLSYKDNLEVEIIKNIEYEKYDISLYEDFYYWNWNKFENEIININLNNYEKILDNNIIYSLLIDFSKVLSLKVIFCFEKDDWWNIYNCINFFYTINNETKIEIEDIIFMYIWETFYKFIEIFNPNIISMWEAVLPISKYDIENLNISWQFIYINKIIIDFKKFKKYEDNLISQKLVNWYLFYITKKSLPLYKEILI